MVRSPNYYIQLWRNQIALEMTIMMNGGSAPGIKDHIVTLFKTVNRPLEKKQLFILVLLLGL